MPDIAPVDTVNTGLALVLALLDRQDRAAFIIDPQARIIAANTAAEKLTRMSSGLPATDEPAGRRLEFTNPQAQQAFASAWRQLHSGTGEPVAFAIPAGCGPAHPVYAELQRVPGEGKEGERAAQPSLLLVLTLLDPALPDARIASLRDRLRLAFRLTTREASVAAELAMPARAEEEVAARLGISTNTLRTHRKAVYAKLGVTSRAGLATLAGRLP
ncbi:PAS and helix-turn-helix domain-containing protein [Stappia sp. MMSF_3263]|uniref:helix-turn-helix transcriptional regulator n=1 Tax=Stappia sp. MMSF_3263 TaxID=3046693 RepID=UPI00273DDDAD|nr:PAS and helix-turn-helix domain-containing protein [Stappia sp. MMSF_3263]